ncbi:MAG: XRE family transcriptional regulator [Gammaproteobacteria bacterium]|nr:XRE family transcriptional regulator [Gammaproteobacteria bacterium]
MSDPERNLASNIRRLREAHNMSQQRMAELSGLPRATWASLESGAANPTLGVLRKAAQALQVSIEELIGAPRNEIEHIPAAEVKERKRQDARIRPLVPDALPGLEFSRMEITPNGRMVGVPHTAGTREYLTCESGRIELIVAGEHWLLEAGDMLVFRGDQRHSYRNPDARTNAVAISVVCFAGGTKNHR